MVPLKEIVELTVIWLVELLMKTSCPGVAVVVPPAMMVPPVAPDATPMVSAPAPVATRMPPGLLTAVPVAPPPAPRFRNPAAAPAVRTSIVRAVASPYRIVFVSFGAAKVPAAASTMLLVEPLVMV